MRARREKSEGKRYKREKEITVKILGILGGGFVYNLSRNCPNEFGLGLFDPPHRCASYVYAYFVIQTAGGVYCKLNSK